jgi:hypothetical protein
LFLGAEHPAGSAYGRLPHFVDVQGTLGNVNVKVDKLKLGGSAAVGTALKLGGAAGGKAGNIIQGTTGALGELGKGNISGALGNLLGGQKPSTNAPAGSATNAPPKHNPLDLLNPFFKKK